METIYYVTAEAECKACHGEGVVLHPLWEKLFDDEPQPTEHEIEEYFLKEGWRYEVPPEEIDCGICEGKGRIACQVVLSFALEDIDLISDLLDRVRRLEYTVANLQRLAQVQHGPEAGL